MLAVTIVSGFDDVRSLPSRLRLLVHTVCGVAAVAAIAHAGQPPVWGSALFLLAVGTHIIININALVEHLRDAAAAADIQVRYGSPRAGDVRHSLADVSAARAAFGYEPKIDIRRGLAEYVAWARSEVRLP